MSSESTDKQPPARLQNMANRPSEPEHLPCPRCESADTKFCYYNNYNLSQPRHFCKSCRRFWTRGGTLRNVPFGGGTRKRSHTTTSPAPPSATTTASAAPSTSSSSTVTTAKPVTQSALCVTVNLNETAAEDLGSFFMEDGGPCMPLGYGSGFDTWDWPPEQVGECDGGGGGGVVLGCNTWQIGCGEGGLADGEECYGWPDLNNSSPGPGPGKTIK